MPTVILLCAGPIGFNELKRKTDGISQRILGLIIKNLERDGIILCHVVTIVSPSVDNELTPFGHSLWSVVKTVGQWAGDNYLSIETTRAYFDQHATSTSPDGSAEGTRMVRF
jgi:DNA-binding HxlR family transcriptional regulator